MPLAFQFHASHFTELSQQQAIHHEVSCLKSQFQSSLASELVRQLLSHPEVSY